MRKHMIPGLLILFLVSTTFGCGSSRAVTERRGLMMPKRSEVYRNSAKYKERERTYSKR